MEQFEFRKKYEGRENVKSLAEFDKLLNEAKADSNDYGAIVEYCSLMMNATFKLIDPGITGFQAGCLMWMMVEKYGSYGPDAILEIRNWNNLAYPQYESNFTAVDKDTWERVQKFATKQIESFGEHGSGEVKTHMISVAEGRVPFGLKVIDV